MNDLVKKNDMNMVEVFSRLEEDGLVKFHTMNTAKMEQIASNMPAINRGCRSLGKKDTQVTRKLMSLQMISCTPYRTLRQILAQIENKRSAIKENTYKALITSVEIDRLEDELAETNEVSDLNEYDRKLKMIELHKKKTDLSDSAIYYEGAMKEIGSLQLTYKEVMKNNNIPEDWDERDMEEAEIGEHVRMVFEHFHRDILQTGKPNMGSMEYCQQFGLTPESVWQEVMNYMNDALYDKGNIEHLYRWLDDMHEKYKDEYKKCMNRLGIDTLIDEDWLYKEVV